MKKVLGTYKEKSGAYSGFIRELRKDYKNVFKNFEPEEFPCEIENYEGKEDEFLEILRATFIE